MEVAPVHTLNLIGVLSETTRIIKAKYIHFIALSLLFLPLAFSIVIYPTLRLSGNSSAADHLHKSSPNHHKAILSFLLYFIIVNVISLCAIATTTYSTYHGFIGNSVTLFAAVKSLTVSFFPIVWTATVAFLYLIMIVIDFLLIAGLINVLVKLTLGFEIDNHWFFPIVKATLFVITIYCLVNSSLTFMVVVNESKWGCAPLSRSSYLVKGMRLVSLFLMLSFGVFSTLIVSISTYCIDHLQPMSSGMFISFTMLVSVPMVMLFVYMTAANTVLYMYCKALHGELAMNIPHGFARDYVTVHFDDEKAPINIVSIGKAS